MSSAQKFSLDPRTVPMEWHEAVAIVQELAKRSLSGEALHARRASDVSMDAEGQVHAATAGPGIPVRGALKAAREAQQVADLRTLLGELLPETAIPSALRMLGQPATEGAEITSLEEFSKALGFFERPGRARELKIVAARQSAAVEQQSLDQKLAELTRKARHEAAPLVTEATDGGWEFLSERSEESQSGIPERHARRPSAAEQVISWIRGQGRVVLVAAGTAAAVLLLATLAYRAWNAQQISTGTAAMARETAAPAPAAPVPVAATGTSSAPVAPAIKNVEVPRREPARTAPVTTPGRQTRSTEPPPVKADARSTPARESTRVVTQPIAAAAPPNPAPPAPLAADISRPPTVPALAQRPYATNVAPTFLPSARLDPPMVSFDTVYDSRDAHVQPARLLRPQLPDIPPDFPAETLGIFEFVVSARGTVDRIRLVRSPADRQYRDIMLMPAAKAWIFQPATRDGLPVRYRLQLLIPQ
jgi:hypothetical protein